MSRRTAYRLLATAVALPALLLAWLWFGPTGTGEFRHSPDGRYTAHASNMSAATVLGGRDRYIEVRVVEESSGREVRRVVHRNPAGADVPDYGSRAGQFITWAEDSSVTIPVAAGRQLLLAVP
ncbi:MAG: hypothetical protein JWO38_5523 [Gemmataceae bacterium]|nr:hypothetical protein [Gemmataceae bacterium]